MDPISIGVGVGVSYLVPLIITCVVAGVMIAFTYFVTRWFYKKEGHQHEVLAESYKAQHQKEKETRQNISRIVEDAGIDLQMLLNLSKAQQQAFKSVVLKFVKQIQENQEATQRLTEVAQSIEKTADETALHSTAVSSDLNKMKSELRCIYARLKSTEEALSLREKELQETILKLQSIQRINEYTTQSELYIQHFAEGLSEVKHTLNLQHLAEKDNALQALHEQNTALCRTIEQLNHTIVSLREKLSESDVINKQHVTEIEGLLSNNIDLMATIERLTQSIEAISVPEEAVESEHVYQLRLFK